VGHLATPPIEPTGATPKERHRGNRSRPYQRPAARRPEPHLPARSITWPDLSTGCAPRPESPKPKPGDWDSSPLVFMIGPELMPFFRRIPIMGLGGNPGKKDPPDGTSRHFFRSIIQGFLFWKGNRWGDVQGSGQPWR
jgi:hypothetical protein